MAMARSASRARAAWRASRWISPPLARLTVAIGSPVEKWTTSSFSSDSYAAPQRSTGKCNIRLHPTPATDVLTERAKHAEKFSFLCDLGDFREYVRDRRY